MLKISINRLADIDYIQDLEILSIDCALYTVRVVIQNQLYRVVDFTACPVERPIPEPSVF